MRTLHHPSESPVTFGTATLPFPLLITTPIVVTLFDFLAALRILIGDLSLIIVVRGYFALVLQL